MKTTPSKGTGKPVAGKSSAPISLRDVQDRIVSVRGVSVLLDADVAALYGVETKRVNEAVRNNPGKFPDGYMFVLTEEETVALRSNFSTTKPSPKSRVPPKAFTEKGLYMLATILKSRLAIEATFAIIETFAQVRALKRAEKSEERKVKSWRGARCAGGTWKGMGRGWKPHLRKQSIRRG